MKLAKIFAISVLVYVGVVILFESMLGYFQPAGQGTLVITTVADDGTEQRRVVSKLDSDGMLYIAVNHWPRAWYRRALAQPRVGIDLGEGELAYCATFVDGAEYDRVQADNEVGIVFRFLTGFPPRYFFRLQTC